MVDIIQKIGTVAAVIITKGLIYFLYLLVREWLICKECLKCISSEDREQKDDELKDLPTTSSNDADSLTGSSNVDGDSSCTSNDLHPPDSSSVDLPLQSDDQGGASTSTIDSVEIDMSMKNYDPPAYDSLFPDDYTYDPSVCNPHLQTLNR